MEPHHAVDQNVLGCLLSHCPRVSEKFYGTGQSWLFTYRFNSPFHHYHHIHHYHYHQGHHCHCLHSQDDDQLREGPLSVFPWAGTNSCFIRCSLQVINNDYEDDDDDDNAVVVVFDKDTKYFFSQ